MENRVEMLWGFPVPLGGLWLYREVSDHRQPGKGRGSCASVLEEQPVLSLCVSGFLCVIVPKSPPRGYIATFPRERLMVLSHHSVGML